jgi:hypothetical protein
MAVAEHNVSRRALLGAAFALPLAASRRRPGPTFLPPWPTPRWIPDQVRNDEEGGRQEARFFAVTKWDRALATLHRAEAALAAAAHEPDEDLYGDILCAFNRALKRLLRAPAPDLAALALKLELAAREAAWELTGAETCIAALAREARRLSPS